MSYDLRVIDKRIVDRSIAKGKLSRDDMDKVLAELPDMESESESINALVLDLDKGEN